MTRTLLIAMLMLAGAAAVAQTPQTPAAPVQINPEGERVARVLANRRPAPRLTGDDYAEIQMLYSRAARSLDNGTDNGRAFAEAFTSDGIYIDTPSGKLYQGTAQLAEFARSQGTGGTVPAVRHLVHNIMIEPAPEGATVKAYVAIVRTDAGGGPAAVADSGQYWDVLEKTAGGWRLRKRNFHRATLAPPNPAPVAR